MTHSCFTAFTYTCLSLTDDNPVQDLLISIFFCSVHPSQPSFAYFSMNCLTTQLPKAGGEARKHRSNSRSKYFLMNNSNVPLE